MKFCFVVVVFPQSTHRVLFGYFRIEANFNKERVIVTFKSAGLAEVQPGAAKIYRKGNRLEVVL